MYYTKAWRREGGEGGYFFLFPKDGGVSDSLARIRPGARVLYMGLQLFEREERMGVLYRAKKNRKGRRETGGAIERAPAAASLCKGGKKS